MNTNITETLTALHQEHLLEHMQALSAEEQLAFAEHLAQLDLSVLDENGTEAKRGEFAPLDAVTMEQIAQNRSRYTETGLEAIRRGKVGAVLLAGGQGSRLGFKKPKGMFQIGIDRKLSIFECLIRNLTEVTQAAGAWVPLFVMTSVDNGKDTRDFFEEHDYFGYSRDYVWFFAQEQLPTVDTDGRLMLSGRGTVSTAPNGNGGWYASMEKTGMLEIVRSKKIEWLNVFAVDNVLQKMADPCFVGAVIESGRVSGAKVVAKAAPDEKVGVICLEDGKPSIVEYYEMTEAMRTQRTPDGRLAYNYGVILNYLFRVDKLDATLHVHLPLHRAFKAIPYMNAQGEHISPEQPNAYKFETLALDMVRLQDDCLVFEVDRKREFAPVKNKTGVDSVDTARELLRFNGIEL